MKFRSGVASLFLLVVIVCLAGCGNQTTVAGVPDQWIRAKDLSVRVSFAEGNEGTIGIRNDSSKEVRFFPVTVKGSYRALGQKEITMRSGEVEILKPGAEFTFPIPPLLPSQPDSSSAPPPDKLYKVQVELGPESLKEIFTVIR